MGRHREFGHGLLSPGEGGHSSECPVVPKNRSPVSVTFSTFALEDLTHTKVFRGVHKKVSRG